MHCNGCHLYSGLSTDYNYNAPLGSDQIEKFPVSTECDWIEIKIKDDKETSYSYNVAKMCLIAQLCFHILAASSHLKQ